MYNIAVCDGNTADAAELAHVVRGLCNEMGVSASVESFRTARALYEAFKEKKYQLVFLETEIGGVYGIVEDEYNGDRKKKSELRWFCEDSKVDGAKVPEPKLLPSQGAAPVPAGSTANAGFVPVEVDNLPF